MRGLIMAIMAIVVLAPGVGCNTVPAAQIESVCTTLCRCAATPLASEQASCIAKCIGAPNTNALDDECADCIYEHAEACSTLVSDCDLVCNAQQPAPTPAAPRPQGILR